MLKLSDTPIEKYLPYFANAGLSVAFLVPTNTGYEKSIMDATLSIRELLLSNNLHDYEHQKQGPNYKVLIPTYFVNCNSLTDSVASLYRPITKKGDPRIWFSNLKKYCCPNNLLAILVFEKKIYVINLSNSDVSYSLRNGGFVSSLLAKMEKSEREVADELLQKLSAIHKKGFLRSVTPGDPGVGDTLEHALGIERNNSKTPDYKGIELKTSRMSRNGKARIATRSTLFAKVPDSGLTYREIVQKYGKYQIPRGYDFPRLQLYETFRCSKVNAYGLLLDVDSTKDTLNIVYRHNGVDHFVSMWQMKSIRDALLIKHRETFWIKATSEMKNGIEYFRYDVVLHTKNPNVSLLAPLFESDKITIDLAGHFKPDGKWRDHGVLFKMLPDDLSLLLGEPTEYIL